MRSRSRSQPALEARLGEHLLDLARRRREPFIAVVVEPQSGRILATGINRSKTDPTQHSEMAALRELVARHPKKRRSALRMYTTAEPCPMCAAAIVWCDFGDVVYGIRRPELITLGWKDFTIRAKAVLHDAEKTGSYAGRLSEFAPAVRRRCVDLFERHRKNRR